jgi:hypothetical protein
VRLRSPRRCQHGGNRRNDRFGIVGEHLGFSVELSPHPLKIEVPSPATDDDGGHGAIEMVPEAV